MGRTRHRIPSARRVVWSFVARFGNAGCCSMSSHLRLTMSISSTSQQPFGTFLLLACLLHDQFATWPATCDMASPIYNHLCWCGGLCIFPTQFLAPVSVSFRLLLGQLQLHQVGLVMLLIYCYCREFVAWNSLSGKLTFGRHFLLYYVSFRFPHVPVNVAIAGVFSVDLIQLASIVELTVLRLTALL